MMLVVLSEEPLRTCVQALSKGRVLHQRRVKISSAPARSIALIRASSLPAAFGPVTCGLAVTETFQQDIESTTKPPLPRVKLSLGTWASSKRFCACRTVCPASNEDFPPTGKAIISRLRMRNTTTLSGNASSVGCRQILVLS